MKAGRNDPCPCGSGRKYKKCCLQEPDAGQAYRRISTACDTLMDRLLQFADKELREDTLDVAMEEFFRNPKEGKDYETFEGFSQLFVPWALFTWHFEEGGMQNPPLPLNATIAELFEQKKGKKLEMLERKILLGAGRPPLSFCEILGTTPGESFRCLDIMTGATKTVAEQSASRVLQPGEVYYCSTASVDDLEILLGTSPRAFAPAMKERVIELRGHLKSEHPALTNETLLQHDAELRALFMEMLQQ